MKRLLSVLSVCVLTIALAAFATPDPDAVVGQWYSSGKESKIEIAKEGDKYCGKLVWLKEPLVEAGKPEAGQPKLDNNNPDPAHKSDPILGLKFLKDFTFDGKENWSGGTIYDPESGKTYKCTMKLADSNTLDVRGYLGIAAFGRTTQWTRVPKEEETKPEEPTAKATQ